MVFRVGLAALVVVVELIRGRFLRKARGAGLAQAYAAHPHDVRLIGALSLAWFCSLFGFVARPEAIAFAAVPLPLAARVAGLGLGVLAVAALVSIHLALGRNFSSVLRIRADHELVRSGPYRWVRHPMYGAFMLLAAAYFLISSNALVGASGACLVFALVYLRVPKEEQDLLAKFGDDYRAYARTTGCILPRLSRRRRPVDEKRA